MPHESAVGSHRRRFRSTTERSLEWFQAGEDLAEALVDSAADGPSEELDEAIELRRRLLSAAEGMPKVEDLVATNLGVDLSHRFGTHGDVDDLLAAIQLGRGLLSSHDPDLRAAAQVNMGSRWMAAYEHLGQWDGPDLAAGVLRDAVESGHLAEPELIGALVNLTNVQCRLYERDGTVHHLDAASPAIERAVALASGSADGLVLASSASFWLTHYEATGRRQSLRRATDHVAEAIGANGSPAEQASRHHLRAQVCLRVYEADGDDDQLVAAQAAVARALELIPDQSPWLATYLSTAATIEHALFEQFGNRARLDAAIDLIEQAAEIKLADGPMRAAVINQLGLLLLQRYEVDGNSPDLARSIAALDGVLSLEDHPSDTRPALLLNASHAYSHRAHRDGSVEDQKRAVALARDALEGTDPGDGLFARRAEAVSAALAEQSTMTGDAALLDEAVALAETASGHEQTPITERYVYANGLAARLTDRDAPGDLELAIGALRRAVETAPPGTMHEATIRYNLGRLLIMAVQRASAWTDEVATAHSDGVAELERVLSSGWPEAALRAGTVLVNVAVGAEQWEACEQIAAMAIDAAEALLAPRQHVEDRERARRDAQGIGGIAALAAMRSNGGERVAGYIGATNGVLVRGGSSSKPRREESTRTVTTVYLACTPTRGIAAIVRPDGTVAPVELPACTDGLVQRVLDELRFDFRASHDATSWAFAVEKTLGTTWEVCSSRLADHLVDTPVAALVPLGSIGWLPIGTARSDGRSLLDTTATFRWLGRPDGGCSEEPGFAPVARAALLAHPGPVSRRLKSLGDEIAAVHAAHPRLRVWDGSSGRGTEPPVSVGHGRGARAATAATESTESSELPVPASEILVDVDLVHVACHVDATAPDPRGSTMALGQPTRADALARAQLAPEAHIVLSACDSGLMSTTLPDESLGVATTLVQQGTRAVTASLWPLDDLEVPPFSGELHRALRSRDPVRGLAEAQRTLRDTAPHVWSSFVVYHR